MIGMQSTESESADTVANQLQKIRHATIDRVWQGIAVVAILGTPVSVSRSFFTGWMPLYSFHLAMALLVIAVYAFRAKLSFTVKSILFLAVFWGVGLGGVFTFGILGTAFLWLIVSSMLVTTLYSVPAGVVVAVAVMATLAVAALGFTSGVLKVSVDANAYIVSAAAWANVLFAALVTPFIVFRAIAAYQETVLELLDQVHRQRDHIRELASHDQLTGLPSLNLALDRLEVVLRATRRSGKKAALLFIDLDGFKTVNDTFGHETGDRVLKEVAARLKSSIRAEDTAARVGGDEFIVISGGLPDEQAAAQVAERAIYAISQPIDNVPDPISVGASIGIGLFPDHASDAQSLRRVADEAMYAVKRSGKNGFAFAVHA